MEADAVGAADEDEAAEKTDAFSAGPASAAAVVASAVHVCSQAGTAAASPATVAAVVASAVWQSPCFRSRCWCSLVVAVAVDAVRRR